MLQFDLKNVKALGSNPTIDKVVQLYKDAGEVERIAELVNLGQRIMLCVPLVAVFHGRRKVKPEILKQFTDDKVPVFFYPSKKEQLALSTEYMSALVTPEGEVIDENAAVLTNVRLITLGKDACVWGQSGYLIAGDFYINNPAAVDAVNTHNRDALALMLSTSDNGTVLCSLDGARFIQHPPVAVETV